MNIDQIALETMREVCAMDDQYSTDQPAQRKARIQIAIRTAIEKALVGNNQLLEDALEREAALAAHVERLRESLELAKNRIALLADVATSKGASVYAAIDIWPQEMIRDLEQTAENTRTRRDLIKKAEACEEIKKSECPSVCHLG